MMSNPIQLKYCKYCKETKHRDEFPYHPMMIDLRQNKCKKCRAAYDKAKREKRNDGNKISHF
jgi:hypothetical protein